MKTTRMSKQRIKELPGKVRPIGLMESVMHSGVVHFFLQLKGIGRSSSLLKLRNKGLVRTRLVILVIRGSSREVDLVGLLTLDPKSITHNLKPRQT